MSLATCQYCGLVYETAMVHECPRVRAPAPTMAETGLVERLLQEISDREALPEHYSREVTQLLKEVAAALAAKEAECVGLRDDYLRRHKDTVDRFEEIIALKARISSLQEQVRGMREALKPFADEASKWKNIRNVNMRPVCARPDEGDEDGIDAASFTVGDLRRAKAALTTTAPSGGTK